MQKARTITLLWRQLLAVEDFDLHKLSQTLSTNDLYRLYQSDADLR